MTPLLSGAARKALPSTCITRGRKNLWNLETGNNHGFVDAIGLVAGIAASDAIRDSFARTYAIT